MFRHRMDQPVNPLMRWSDWNSRHWNCWKEKGFQIDKIVFLCWICFFGQISQTFFAKSRHRLNQRFIGILLTSVIRVEGENADQCWPLYHHTGLIVKRFIKCPIPGLFSFIAICPTVNNKTRDLYKILPMTGFKQRISTNWVTTTAHSRLATVQRFSHLILTAQILLNELAH